MVKLIAIELRGPATLQLRFSDGTAGTFDFSRFVAADTAMTRPLADPDYFARCFIEAGALAWPNGFDLSAASLQRTLQQNGGLHRDPAAA